MYQLRIVGYTHTEVVQKISHKPKLSKVKKLISGLFINILKYFNYTKKQPESKPSEVPQNESTSISEISVTLTQHSSTNIPSENSTKSSSIIFRRYAFDR